MKKLMYVLAGVAMAVACSDTALAQAGTSAVPFLLISPDSRASGMGEAGAGLADDAGAVYWNPAGLAFLNGGEVSYYSLELASAISSCRPFLRLPQFQAGSS